MAQLFERFNQHCQSAPNKMAFIDGSLQLSYGQLADKIDQV
ncbi:MAG: (2,3-dihydroxybenzoyl)adenylate synthase, partial [Thiomicrospira sp.]|nr:(2,3-dihydroxybenzoyl)adenylate synthase [Thiomicrospira sp.]